MKIYLYFSKQSFSAFNHVIIDTNIKMLGVEKYLYYENNFSEF